MRVFIFLLSFARGNIPHKSTQLFSKISVYSDIFVQGGIRDSACLQYNSSLPLLLSTDGFQANNRKVKLYFFVFST